MEESIKNKTDDIKNKINQLKAEVFDMIKQQEMLVVQNNDIQNSKLKKVEEINKLESNILELPKSTIPS
jgi:uncharacterized protein YoxC